MCAHLLKKCPCCQKLSFIKLPIEKLKFTAATYNPMQRINVDTIHLHHTDEYGNKYIIVIIDCFSRWVYLYASSDVDAINAAQALLQFVGFFGVPDEIQSDMGTEFVNNTISELIKLFGTTHKLNIAAHSKEENAIVERANKEVLRHIRGLIFEKNVISNWSQNLPLVQRIINSSLHESIGCTPSQILFGTAIDLDKNLFLPPIERTPLLNLPKWLSEKLTIHDALIKRAQEIQRIKDNTHMSTIKPQLTSYNIGEYILLEYPSSTQQSGPPSKLLTNLRGPMKIINITRSKI